jgi:aspartyl-tRNA(Asn)/glutamyl-tRNA(Gln) amidotransferase subunit A
MRHATRREFTVSAVSGLAAGAASTRASAGTPAGAASPPAEAQAATTAARPADLAALSLADAADLIRTRRATPTDLVEACFARIDVYDRKVNAFITLTRDQALAHAKALETELQAGRWRGPLHGVPIALKDNIDTAGVRTTAASAVFDDRVPAEDATVWKRLRDAGAISVGKLNLHEFAIGGTSATSYFGPVRNPWALDRNPGGSSGGSAAAVAVDLCYAALGTDTGGSIRTPASYCGIVGLKPTYGLASIRGIVPLTYSLDHCGPLTRTVHDAALMLNAMAGYDRLDIGSVEHPAEDYVAGMRQPVSNLRVGVLRTPFFDHVDPEIATAVEEAIRTLRTMVREVRDATMPSVKDIGLGGEFPAYHADFYPRLSGRYMLQVRRSLERGSDLKAVDYVRSRWKLDLMRRTIDDSFKDVDLVVLPTRRRTPRTVDAAIKREETDKPRNPELENTQPFNYYGIPTISVPCGFTNAGLPVGLMIAGPRFAESRVLALAHAFERATEWHKRKPPIRPDTPVPAIAVTDEDKEQDQDE